MYNSEFITENYIHIRTLILILEFKKFSLLNYLI